ncbi:hypothetical protein TUM4445_41330 [Shewanella sp. MBTL60-112-B2]|nr:hypothetical protein TUM4444_41360 [Shewanella sp. MBTL60-112-B1]GIU41130.1 hypothetical protein TUM4445_41330 [Shewanella sp. MBTL60-112-B2]
MGLLIAPDSSKTTQAIAQVQNYAVKSLFVAQSCDKALAPSKTSLYYTRTPNETGFKGPVCSSKSNAYYQ